MRRRQRRLRSRLRHERMTVATTLAEMTHHIAPRGPKMARVGEGVEHEQHDGLHSRAAFRGAFPGGGVAGWRRRSGRTTVSFLLRENLKLQKEDEEEEEKERRRKWEEAQHEARMRELDHRVWADEQLTPT